MNFTRHRVLWLTGTLSLLVHIVVYLGLGAGRASSPHPDARGVVSVDFIEPVVHSGPARPIAPRAPLPRRDARPPTPGESPAATDVPTAEAGSAGPAVHAGGEPGAINAFVGAVGRLIDQRKTYPRAALRRELEGRVVVAITLGPDGALLRAEVETPCPFPSLDEAALTAVRGVPRYPPLPPGSGPTLHLHVPIVFKIAR